MSKELPTHFSLTYSAEAIASRVRELAAQITPWALEIQQQSGMDIVSIPVLRGGIFFFADLVREIGTSVHITPVRTWAYEVLENQQMKPNVEVHLGDSHLGDSEPKGRSILLIDDICDSGRTLAALHESLIKEGAKEVRSAVLVRRVIEDQQFNPDYVGFEYHGPEWFVGYGMEDKERWRNLPSIYTISNSGAPE